MVFLLLLYHCQYYYYNVSLSLGAFLKDDVVGSRQGDGASLNTVSAIGHRGNRHRGRGNPQLINSGGGYLDRLVEPLGKIITNLYH